MSDNTQNNVIIYQSEDGLTKINVNLQEETVWLSQQQMAELYQTSRTNVVEHIRHIYEEGELTEDSTCRKFRQVQSEGKREVSREIPFYNLDMIISLGYRVKSSVATRFRIWATKLLNEYIRKGFALDDNRLKNLGGGSYWKELLERIRLKPVIRIHVHYELAARIVQASTTIPRPIFPLSFSSGCRTRFIMPCMAKLPPKSLSVAPMLKKSLWD